MTLTKQRIARQISEAQGVPLAAALQRVEALLAALKPRLARGERVMITNFGTFEVVERRPRRGIDPTTGERIVIPAHRSIVFHPAPRLRQAVDDE
jgi:nucleoid DNA-binding protein